MGFSSVFRNFGSKGKSRGGTVAWRERGEILLSPIPQTCLLALSLDTLSFVQTSLLVHPRLPSSVLTSSFVLIPFSTPLPHSLTSLSSFFRPLLPRPPTYPTWLPSSSSRVSSCSSPLSWSCSCCSSWFSSSSSPPLVSSCHSCSYPFLTQPLLPLVLPILPPCTFCRVPLPPLPSPLLIGFHRLLLFIHKHHHHHQHPNRH